MPTSVHEYNIRQDVVIPEGLAPGFYLLRAELLTLHEADVSHVANNHRGIVRKDALAIKLLCLPPC